MTPFNRWLPPPDHPESEIVSAACQSLSMSYRKGYREHVALRDELARLDVNEPACDHHEPFYVAPVFSDPLFCRCHQQLVSWVETGEGGMPFHRWAHCPNGKPDPATIRRSKNGKGSISCR